MPGNSPVDHLLRRAGFGASQADLAAYADLSFSTLVERLVDYETLPDDVDSKIGQPGYVGVTARGPFSPNSAIDDARQRWLFRMVHSQRPLQEKMTLFWHNHFATAYSKVAGAVGTVQGARLMAGKPGEVAGPPGQYELLRQYALGNFRDLLIAVARDPAMLIWLDGRTNVRQQPQENFAREVMELFTWGVGNYTEQDVYAAARVFTGWNLGSTGSLDTVTGGYYQFVYNANQHETSAKTFTFSVDSSGGHTIPARSAAQGMQDGIDFLTALAMKPETAQRLARKLWEFFITDAAPPDPVFVDSVATTYLQNGTEMKPVVRAILFSRWFQSPGSYYTRYSWPAEFVVRAIKEMGGNGFSVDSARTPLTNMGQTLFEPPNVGGWNVGPGWFTTGTMLARMNFAATLAFNQKFNLGQGAASFRSSPGRLLDYLLQRFTPAPYDSGPYGDLQDYLNAGAPWTGSDAQLNTKASGLARLIVGSGEYQLV
jgi:uncharacterized protein (DUF1800 family)